MLLQVRGNSVNFLYVSLGPYLSLDTQTLTPISVRSFVEYQTRLVDKPRPLHPHRCPHQSDTVGVTRPDDFTGVFSSLKVMHHYHIPTHHLPSTSKQLT